MLGGSSRAAARRAGRFGLGFLAQTDEPSLQPAYEEAARQHATAYYAWSVVAGLAETTASLTPGDTLEELRRANGSHRVVTVAGAVELIRASGMLGLQPLCGGLDPDVAWTYLRRVVDDVVPAVAGGS